MRAAAFAIVLVLSASVYGQPDLDKVVAAERAFAAAAKERGVKTAFVEYLTDSAVLFMPGRVNGQEWWQGQQEWGSMLLWYPELAGVSSNGVIGYTTGPWEVRSKEDRLEAAGQFASIWQKQPDGEYRVILDIGISHEPTSTPQPAWQGPADQTTALADHEAGDAAVPFFEMARAGTVTAAYKRYADRNIRLLREGRPPVTGSKNIGDALKGNAGRLEINKRLAFIGTRDLAYVDGGYRRTVRGAVVQTGNFLQVWRFDGKYWKIVLDVFKPMPDAA